MFFRDRIEAGRQLAAALQPYQTEQPVVLGIPRGGVVVAAEVAKTLGAPMDVLIARKIGAPHNPELAIGAVMHDGHGRPSAPLSAIHGLRGIRTSMSKPGHAQDARICPADGIAVLDEQLIRQLHIPEEYLQRAISRETAEIERRMQVYRGKKPYPDLTGRTIIIVDDGIATGYTIEAAVRGILRQKPRAVIIAVPVAPPDVVARLKKVATAVVCLYTPEPFYAVGQFYQNFTQTSDAEVIALLEENKQC